MGLYLCVFATEDSDDELEGVEVGSYDDFHQFREAVSVGLESGEWGSHFPVLMTHPDSRSSWLPDRASDLERELLTIADGLVRLPAAELTGSSKEVADEFCLVPQSLYECFLDVDGLPLVERLLDLVHASERSGQPIMFM